MQSAKLRQYALNARQAARYLDLSVGHLYNLLSHGRGPGHIRYGGHLRFRETDLEAWVADRSDAVSPRPGLSPPAPAPTGGRGRE